jgi:phosphate transport system substrate-binding protein
VLAGALALLAGSALRAEVRVVGTDLLGVDASRALYEFSTRAGFPLALAFDGSRPGLDLLKSGSADLGLLVLAPEEAGAVAAFQSIPLAYHGVVVLVPVVVPLEQITLSQLRDIFGESGANNLSRWGDLGLSGDIAASAIVPHLPAVGQGITAEFFRRTVLQERPFRSPVVRDASPAEMVLKLAGDRRALALAPARPPNTPGIKVVPVAARANDPAYFPTPENLHSGDYPLSLPLRVVFRRESTPALRPLLRFLFSDEFAPLLERAGLIPLAPAARQQHSLAFEKL